MLDVKALLLKLIPIKEDTTLSGGYINGSWQIRRYGNVVQLRLVDIKAYPTGSFSLGVTIPQEYRPLYSTTFVIIPRASSYRCLGLSVETNGNLSFYNYTSAVSSVSALNQTLTWIVGG